MWLLELLKGILGLIAIAALGYSLLFAPAFLAVMVAMLVVLIATFVRSGRRV